MDASKLARTLFGRLRSEVDPRVKDAVLRRLTQRVALMILGNRLAGLPPVHDGAIVLADEVEKLPLGTLHDLFEEAVGVLLVGYVVPIQAVKADIAEARDCWLGPCVCRHAGRVADLYVPGTRDVYLSCPEDEARGWFDALLDAHERVRGHDSVTAVGMKAVLNRFHARRAAGDPGASAAAFFAETWPRWEILLDHPRYVSEWRETVEKNGRTWRIHPEILTAWVDLLYRTRGVIYTSMAVVDERYTICACPGPEVDRGCLLFNWTWYAGNTHVLAPNEAGARRSPEGEILPCERFPGRAGGPCVGCGCAHGDELRPDGGEDVGG